MISSIKRSISSDLRPYIVKGILSRFLTHRLIFAESLHCRSEELKRKRFVSYCKGRRVVVILPWCWIFSFKDILGSFLNSGVKIRLIYHRIKVCSGCR